jgi:hypothetical protein
VSEALLEAVIILLPEFGIRKFQMRRASISCHPEPFDKLRINSAKGLDHPVRDSSLPSIAQNDM